MKKFILGMLVVLLAIPAYAAQGPDLDFSGYVRLRGYQFENFWDFNSNDDWDNWSVFRLKASLQAKASFDEYLSAVIRITNQNYGEGVTYAGAWEADNISNKMFLDNAYIDMRYFAELPLHLRLGRQNVMYGSGFVVFDGQSQYASTSLYFDGIKATLEPRDNWKLDILYLKDQENNRDNDSDDDITLSGFYFTGHCPVLGGQQEVYLLNKSDEGTGVSNAYSGKDIWMAGLRLTDKFDCGIDYSIEGAYQWGDFDEGANIDQEAWGLKTELGYTLKDVDYTPRFFIGYTYMSGDDPDTSEYEGWDSFYGGWPQYGDLLAWMYVAIPPNTAADPTGFLTNASTTGEANYTNLQMPCIGASAKFGDLFVKASYTMLTIDEVQTPGTDDDLGDYYQLTAKYMYTKNLSFSLYAGLIDPGDAVDDYFAANGIPLDPDEAYEVYWEARLDF